MMKWPSLTRNGEFQKVYREGVKKVGHLLVVYLYPAAESRRGIVASRKVGGAVQRNRAKRLLRAAMAAGLTGQRDWVEAALKNPVLSAASHSDSTLRSAESSGSIHETGGASLSRNDAAGLWIVLVARRNILEASSAQVQCELDEMLRPFAPGYSTETRRDPD